MDQPGNNHLLLRASQPATPAYNGQHAAADRMRELLARIIMARVSSLEDTVLTLAEALLRPALRVPQPTHASHNGRN